MHISIALLRAVAAASAIAAVFALAPAAYGQDCKLPGEEEYPTADVCNLEPVLTVTPPSSISGRQTAVPVTIVATDHYSDNAFGSFRIVVDEDDVTSTWNVVVTETGTGPRPSTGQGKTFTSSGTVTLSDSLAERTLLVELCDQEYCRTETRTFKLLRPGVEVGPDGASVTELAAATRTTPFAVKNTGITTATFALSAECRDVQGQRVTPCSVASSITLAPRATASVTVTYPATQQHSMVTVLVRARQTDAPGIEDAGWMDAAIRSPAGNTASAPLVTLVPLNAGATVERGQCVTVATTRRGAYECGDLRIAHGLPVHRTRGRTWGPALLYSSQHAHPRPVVYADVTVPAGTRKPDAVEMVVSMADGTVHRATYTDTAFHPGATRRVAVQWDGRHMATGLYGYSVQVISHFSTGSVGSPTYAGEVAVVNRNSYFGDGWWLAGLE